MNLDKGSKMVLGAIGAGCTAITANPFFGDAVRAWAGVVGAIAGGVFLYRLDPKTRGRENDPEGDDSSHVDGGGTFDKTDFPPKTDGAHVPTIGIRRP